MVSRPDRPAIDLGDSFTRNSIAKENGSLMISVDGGIVGCVECALHAQNTPPFSLYPQNLSENQENLKICVSKEW
jgi:hypothetical protein